MTNPPDRDTVGGNVERLAVLCDCLGLELRMSHDHDHGFDREGWLEIHGGKDVVVAHKAAGESWEYCANTALRKIERGERP